ncbi:MAG: RNA methyltransferase [Flavobacteriaceae bacterium]|nr:RNA methyltransferase [Bacteroidia bacterium]NNK88898.1 RNA methyltransferase [Flavobacteriaceae bacterium]
MRKLKMSELDRMSVDEFKSAEKTPIIVILDNVRSLNNVGALFRTCDAFRIKKVILCGITATPPHKEIQKTALGSTLSVDWEYFESTQDVVKDLKSNGIKIIAVEQTENATSLEKFKPESNTVYAVIFGHEVNGIAQQVLDICDHWIEIPQYGTKHSLNISVSAGIVIWDLFKSLRLNQ